MPTSTVHVWLVEASGEDVTDRALAMLPVSEVDRLRAVVAPHRYHRLCAQAALRTLAAAATGSTPLLVRLERGRHGKPRLGGGSGLHVSLAHSGRYCAVALTAAGPVGVDLEQPRAAPDPAGLARTVLSELEYRRWRGLAEPEATRALFRSWTYKEAVLKALGTGLSGDVRQVSTRTDRDGRPVLESLPAGAGGPAGWTLRDLSAEYRLPSAVAVAAPDTCVRLHRALIGELVHGNAAAAASRLSAGSPTETPTETLTGPIPPPRQRSALARTAQGRGSTP